MMLDMSLGSLISLMCSLVSLVDSLWNRTRKHSIARTPRLGRWDMLLETELCRNNNLLDWRHRFQDYLWQYRMLHKLLDCSIVHCSLAHMPDRRLNR